MKKLGSLRIGIGQINPTVGNFEENTAKISFYIQAAEERGLDLVVFPELSICGYPVWDLAYNKDFIAANLRALDQIRLSTKGKRVTAIVGFIDYAHGKNKKNYNALAVIHNGKIIKKQYKTLLPTYDVFLEQVFFLPAKNHSTFSLKGISFGPTICEDIWDDFYELKPAKILAKKGAQILINISASPYHKESVERRNEIISKRAKEYGLWIVYANQTGGQDDLIFDGRSLICDPQGKVQYMAPAFKEGLFSYELRLGKTIVQRAKKWSLDSRSYANDTIDQTKEMYQALCLGLYDYLRKNNFKKVIVGLSGGIDSALVATIARDALGPESVIGVSMPGPFSSKHSVTDAEALAKNLGIEFRVRPIKTLYQKFIAEAAAEKKKRKIKAGETGKVSLAMENLQARLRGLELMYISNDEGALLISTGNKSELGMGFGTLYGDLCGGLSVIGDVYKTDVYKMAHYRNKLGKVIPESTIRKAPSAELRPNQVDQDTLPPYDVLDQILFLYIEKNKSFGDIVKTLRRKTSEKVIRSVIRRVDGSEYKRRQLPPALRVTEKAWFGRRMPITNKFKQ